MAAPPPVSESVAAAQVDDLLRALRGEVESVENKADEVRHHYRAGAYHGALRRAVRATDLLEGALALSGGKGIEVPPSAVTAARADARWQAERRRMLRLAEEMADLAARSYAAEFSDPEDAG